MWQWNGSELIEVAQSMTQRRQRHTTARKMWQLCHVAGWLGGDVCAYQYPKEILTHSGEVVFRSGTCVLRIQRGFVSLQWVSRAIDFR